MRLLNDEEIEQARQEGIKENFRDISLGVIQQGQDYDWYQRRSIAKAQDKQTESDTLKKVGAWLNKSWSHRYAFVTIQELEALLQGKWIEQK